MNALIAKSENPTPSAWRQAAVFSICLTFGVSAFAVPRTWTGAGADALATTPANWGGTAPQTGDDVVLNSEQKGSNQ